MRNARNLSILGLAILILTLGVGERRTQAYHYECGLYGLNQALYFDSSDVGFLTCQDANEWCGNFRSDPEGCSYYCQVNSCGNSMPSLLYCDVTDLGGGFCYLEGACQCATDQR